MLVKLSIVVSVEKTVSGSQSDRQQIECKLCCQGTRTAQAFAWRRGRGEHQRPYVGAGRRTWERRAPGRRERPHPSSAPCPPLRGVRPLATLASTYGLFNYADAHMNRVFVRTDESAMSDSSAPTDYRVI